MENPGQSVFTWVPLNFKKEFVAILHKLLPESRKSGDMPHLLRESSLPRVEPKVYSIWETLFRKKVQMYQMSNKSRYWLRRRKISQEITNFIKSKETTNITTARKKAHCLYQSDCSFFQQFLGSYPLRSPLHMTKILYFHFLWQE